MCRVIHLLEGFWTKEGKDFLGTADIEIVIIIVIAANIISSSGINLRNLQPNTQKALGMRDPKPSG